MPRWQLALFDLDGTLADTLQDIADAANAALVAHGLAPHPLDAYRFLVGRGAPNLFRAAAPALADGSPQAEAQVAALVETYLAHYALGRFNHTRPYDGIPELLDACVAGGIPLGVLSNKVHPETCAVVAQMFGRWPFAAIQGHEERFPPKPDPASALDICRRLGVAPANVLYIGDTSTDMQTAKAAGFFALGAAWGFREAAELRAHGADAIATTPQAARAFLGGKSLPGH